jgi:CHASE3 domain sensor protein/HAMP domain-containing protein
MSAFSSASEVSSSEENVSHAQAKMSMVQSFKNLNIGRKLTIGFGILVLLTLLIIALIYQGSRQATFLINQTEDQRAPTALASSSAQANLLRMLAAARGYLALGDPLFLDDYYTAETAFEKDLGELKQHLSTDIDSENKDRVAQLELSFAEWKPLPEQLFELRDDRLAREPAYRILAIEGVAYGGRVLLDLQKMIDSQALRDPSRENIELLRDMARFQGSFAAMLSGLRNYVTTQNRIFRQEYDANLTLNNIAWQTLLDKRSRGLLTGTQQELLNHIEQNRTLFLALPEEQIFTILESDRSREDLYLFATEAVPLNEKMLALLDQITVDQQNLLRSDLSQGRSRLNLAVRQTLTFGFIALVLGTGMSFLFRENIAGPIRRLTSIAEQIRSGDLQAQAPIESRDEIGILAHTFNNMTGKLRQTLFQVQKEKKRADDLLNVVIPIGVDLSSEKDFNRLLEKMLLEAKSFCRANAGILYLRTPDNKLRFEIVRNDNQQIAMGGTTGTAVPYTPLPLQDPTGEPNCARVATHAAVMGQTINVVNAQEVAAYDFSGPDSENGYYGAAFLSIPLLNSQNQVIGVMELVDPADAETGQVIGFDTNLQQMMESFSSLAVAALEAYIREQSLRAEIQQLRIEIDEAKRQQQVSEIVDTDFFSELQAKARDIRRRHRPAD